MFHKEKFVTNYSMPVVLKVFAAFLPSRLRYHHFSPPKKPSMIKVKKKVFTLDLFWVSQFSSLKSNDFKKKSSLSPAPALVGP